MIQVYYENGNHAIHFDTHPCRRHGRHYLGSTSWLLPRCQVLDIPGLPGVPDRIRSQSLLVTTGLINDLQTHVQSLGGMGQCAYGNVIHPGLGDLAHRLKIDTT